MCRMLLAAGNFNVKTLLEGLVIMAQDRNERHEDNLTEASLHDHGWGLIYRNPEGLQFYKSPLPCFDDPQLKAFEKLQTSLLVLHARRASKGEISYVNSHPFWDELQNESYGFCHNGTIYQPLAVSPAFQPKGTVDSEIYFYHLLGNLNFNDPIVSFRQIIGKISSYSSLNAFLCHRNYAFALNKFSKNPQYYTMKISVAADSIIISSEVLPNLKDRHWQKLNNGSLIQLDFTTPTPGYQLFQI
ncbi:class II glutamine amidotransferase [candidate division KSB1 bacterium]|nr:class II glutamine amidotransferase [candidate division KSB1 bacterium]